MASRHPEAGILTPIALTCMVCTAMVLRASCQDVDTHSGRSRKAESKLPRMTVGLSTRLATSSRRSPEADSGMTPPTCSPTHHGAAHQQGHAVECALACKTPVGWLQQLVPSSYVYLSSQQSCRELTASQNRTSAAAADAPSQMALRLAAKSSWIASS